MKVAIMQPYFMPFYSYFELIASVDVMVILDDVNFITRGYIHRNYIPDMSGVKRRFGLQIEAASQNKKINQLRVKSLDLNQAEMLLRNYRETRSHMILSDAVRAFEPNCNLAEYVTHTINVVCKYTAINTKIQAEVSSL